MKASSCHLLQMHSIIPRFQIGGAAMNSFISGLVMTDTVFLSDRLRYNEGGSAADRYAKSRYSV